MRAFTLALLCVVLALCVRHARKAEETTAVVDKRLAFGRLPLAFVPNEGQTNPEVRFFARTPLANTFLTDTGAVFAVKGSRSFAMRLLGARTGCDVSAEEPLPGRVNLLLGNDPQRWRTNLETFGRVRYRDVYPGVDLVFHGDPQRLEYDFELAAGADPAVIRVRFEGAEQLRVDETGDLVFTVDGKTVRQGRPVVYQWVDGERREVSGAYRLMGTEVAFTLEGYDARYALLIDPVLQYSTYLGGSIGDYVSGMAVDSAGATYLAGYSYGSDFPVAGAYQSTSGGGSDAFVAKLSSTGALVYATYLGGSVDDQANAIAVDGAGRVHVTGFTLSNNFPTMNAAQSSTGTRDAFVTKLEATGSTLSYSTYWGGAQHDDVGTGIQVDAAGNAYVSGATYSFNFPTVSPIQGCFSGSNFDAFVAKVSPAGVFLFSSCLGGSGNDNANSIAVDNAGNIYLAGSTNSGNFPTRDALKTTYDGGPFSNDGFVTRINADAGLGYSTYLGGGSVDLAYAVAVDSAGSAYVTGYTRSFDFPTLNALQPAPAGLQDVFVSKLWADAGLAFSTFLGGTNTDQGKAIAVDSAGNSYLTGYTNSSDFPMLDALQPTYGGGAGDAFIAKLSASGSSLTYCTYFGGSDGDEGAAVAVDSSRNIYVAGSTSSANYVTVNAAQPVYGGFGDGFVAKFDVLAPVLTSVTPNFGSTSGGTAVTLSGAQFASGVSVSWGGASLPVTFVNPTTLTATTPSHAAGAVGILVTNTDGRSAYLDAGFLYVSPPVVNTVSPSSGPVDGGTTVTLSGSGFNSGATVSIGGTEATTVTWVSDTTLTAVTPAHSAGAVGVVVTNPPGISGSKANAFTYIAPPTLSSISPVSGPVSGGTAVVLTGTSFVSGAVVRLGGVAATNVVVTSPTQITATTPANSAGSVDVVIENPDGLTAILPGAFTYVAPPSITSVTPNVDSTAGGTIIDIQINGWIAGVQIFFDGVPVSHTAAITRDGKRHFFVTSPAHAAGLVNVVVRNPDGQQDQAPFLYVAPPTVTQVNPMLGRATGGTAVSITGTGFATDGGTSVTFGGAAATSVVVINSTQLTAMTPAHDAGTADVVASVAGVPGAPLTSGFTFVNPPTVTAVSPSTGAGLGGTAVTITGTNFLPGTTVRFGGVPATNITLVNSTTLTAVTPAHAAGPVEVLVTTIDGMNGSLANGFTYDALAPVVQAVNPSSGPIAGGTVISVSGSSFLTGATVTLGGVSATNVSVTDTVITATVPEHAPGAVEVRVTNPDNQTGALPNGFTYLSPPSVASLAPASGPTAGGTSVTLSGADFQSGASVFFGGSLANVGSLDPTTIIVSAPEHAAGDVDVVVQNPDGQQSAARTFTYVAPPAILTLTPNIGGTAGGTVVTISGSGFAPGATVTFDGEAGTEVTVADAATLTATTPAHAAGRVDVVVKNPDGQSGTAALGYEYSDVCTNCQKPVSQYAFGCSMGANGLSLAWLLALALPAMRRRRRS